VFVQQSANWVAIEAWDQFGRWQMGAIAQINPIL